MVHSTRGDPCEILLWAEVIKEALALKRLEKPVTGFEPATY
jgi:hypothetical protein